MAKNKFKRPLALLLCMATLLCALLLTPAIPVLAKVELALDNPNLPKEIPLPQATPGDGMVTQPPQGVWTWLELLSYMFNWQEGLLVTNTRNAWQSVFGFNEVYDFLSPVAGVVCDTMRVRFNYSGKEYMVQLWKGIYGYGMFTGGEIGMYSKPEGRLIGQYDVVPESEWIGMEMAIFHNDQWLFTRPLEKQWWCTGYKWYSLPNATSKPRSHVTMESRLSFNNEEMARLFCESLNGAGFSRLEGNELFFDRPETYTLNGSKVHLLWRHVTQGVW